jgi:putative ABC transport system ATP-binding protein
MDALVQLDNVTKRYEGGGAAAVSNVSMAVGHGEAVAVMGPSGSGKSTLLNLIAGMDRPTSGAVRVGDERVDMLSETGAARFRRRQVGMIFQTFNLIPTLSAQENVEAALVPLDMHAAARKERAGEALAEVGLGDRARHLPSELSGGQQQRVAIARGLVKRPGVLLADEPTGNLDEGTRDEIITLLERVWRERGLTLVIVTHDSSVARRAQRIAIMRNGQLSTSDAAPAWRARA